MTSVRFSHQVESSNLGKGDIDDLFNLVSNRGITSGTTGGFADNWNDAGPSSGSNVTTTPFKLMSYHIRVWTTRPCILWSSDVEQYRSVQLGTSNDTSFNQFNLANSTVKKWTLTDGGKVWSHLGKDFIKSVTRKSKSGKKYTEKVGRARYYNNKEFKLQIKNIDPNTTPQDCAYYAIIEGRLEYDAVA